MDWRTTTIDIGDDMRLRAWRADDLDALLRHADDEQVSRGTSDRFPFPYTRADGEAFLSGRVIDFSAPVFAIDIDGEACGGIGVRPGRRAPLRCGARPLAGTPVLGTGKNGPCRRRVRVVGDADAGAGAAAGQRAGFNTGSARVLLKNGFVEEGVQRNAVVKRGKLHDLRMFARVRNHVDDAP